MSTKPWAVIACLTAGLACGSSSARAFDGIGGYYGFPWFGHGNNGPAAYSLGNIPAPPYFALHPPVYYSGPVPRSYGQSPFACPGCGRTERTRVAQVMVNPHARIEAAPGESVEKSTSVAATPKRLVNPFYRPAGHAAALADDRH